MIYLYIILFLIGIAFGYYILDSFDKKNKHGKLISLWYLLLIVLLLSGIITVPPKQIDVEITEEELQQQAIEQMTFEDSVFTYIVELNIKHPNIVLKQAKIESGNFKSKVYLENNNMFGFKRAFKRANTQVGTNRGYAVYTSWRECVIDYALYQTYSAKNLSREEYINFLGKHYAEDPNYKNLIR